MTPKYKPGDIVQYYPKNCLYKIKAICNLPNRYNSSNTNPPPLVYLMNLLNDKYESVGQVYHQVEEVDVTGHLVDNAIQVLYGGL